MLTLLGLFACGTEADSGTPAAPSDAFTVVGAVEVSDVEACLAPRSEPTWVEVGESWGFLRAEASQPDHLDGGGLVVRDLDGDTLLDVMVHFPGEVPQRATRSGGTWTSAPLGGDTVDEAATVLDADADGDLDLLFGGRRPVTLVQGDSGWTVSALFPPPQGNGFGISDHVVVDADLDGDDDVFVLLNSPGDEPELRRDYLWRRDGDSWVLVPDALAEVPAQGKGFDAVALDLDVDGAAEVYVANDMGSQYGGNVLWRATEEGLVDVSAGCACDLALSGMGVSAGDFTGGDEPDLFVAGTAYSALLQGGADGTFFDVAAATGADALAGPPEMVWGSAGADLDNDGQLDLLQAQGDLWGADDAGAGSFESPLRWMRQDDGMFADQGPSIGLPTTGSWRGVVAADLNDDGVLDVVANDVEARAQVFLSEGCTEAGWLAVEAPEGSVVEVEVDGETRRAWVTSHSGFGASGPPVAWFGLGEAESVDAVRVLGPLGEIGRVEGIILGRRWMRVR
ncbi:MAG: CRTAC1 family protein [Pseudomonadota bacterium]|nr:CRTAC1 family protein [Pseudomonadota bacterium]